MRLVGFGRGARDWRAGDRRPGRRVVYVAAPNMLHVELVEAACEAGKHVFCEKPVGGTPEQTVRAERAARRAGVISGVGTTTAGRRWSACGAADRGRRAGRDHQLPRPLLLHVRGRPAGLLSWRFRSTRPATASPPTSSATPSTSRTCCSGRSRAWSGTDRDLIRERPIAQPGAGPLRRGRPGDPTGEVTNEDYAGDACEFASGVRGTFEASRAIVGPESRWRSTSTAPRRAGLEPREAQRAGALPPHDDLGSGYTTVFAGDRFPYHGHFVPGGATASASRTWS